MKYLMEYRGDLWIAEITKEQLDMLHYLSNLDIFPDDFEYTDIDKIRADNISGN